MPEVTLNAVEFIIVIAAFVVAGLVKGVIGGGLPAVGVPILAGTIEPAKAAALMLVPVVVTNIWQMLQGGLFREVMRRYWLFFAMLATGSLIGAQILVTTAPRTMVLAIGILVVVLSPLPFIPQRWAIPERTQRWLNPVAALAMGIIGGATVMLAPVILYFVALRIEKDLFVASMAVVAMSAMVPLFASLAVSRTLGFDEVVLSALALIPSAIGMGLGIWLRSKVTPRGFQRLLSAGLFALGLNLVRKSLLAG